MKGNTIFTLMMLFLFVCVIAFITIGIAGNMKEPDNQTSPQEHADYVATQHTLHPILIGLNGTQIAILAILIFAGTALFVGVLRKWFQKSPW
jgi:uncharacterized membrane protein YgdD (TMEM256/DUF423 family)